MPAMMVSNRPPTKKVPPEVNKQKKKQKTTNFAPGL